jgi:hypothetical protein
LQEEARQVPNSAVNIFSDHPHHRHLTYTYKTPSHEAKK